MRKVLSDPYYRQGNQSQRDEITWPRSETSQLLSLDLNLGPKWTSLWKYYIATFVSSSYKSGVGDSLSNILALWVNYPGIQPSHHVHILVTIRSDFVAVWQRQGWSHGSLHQAGNYEVSVLYLVLCWTWWNTQNTGRSVPFHGKLNRHCFLEKSPYFSSVLPVAIEMVLGDSPTPE